MLLGGVPGVPGANVVIIGGGVVGTNAAQMALGMGANVTILDRNVERLRHLDQVCMGGRTRWRRTASNIAEAVRDADLVIGGVLIAGAKAPKLVTRADGRVDAAGLRRRRRRDRPGRLHSRPRTRPRTAIRRISSMG